MIRGPNRAMLVALSVEAWLKEHESGRRQSLSDALEIITEVMPTLPRGFDTLPVSCAMGRSLKWEPELWAKFIELHWSRWSGPRGDSNAEVLRRMLLEAVEDPELRMRLEKLPKAGSRP